MKKIAILTSILALAACGGGSGGGGSDATPVVPNTPSIGGNTTIKSPRLGRFLSRF